MSSSTTGRVSKGVFVFKGKKKTAECDQYFMPGHSSKDNEDRLQVCLELLERTQEKIQLMQCELNTKLFEDLVQYIATVHMKRQSYVLEKRYSREVPTAALVTGVNTPDHDGMFGNLVMLIRDRVTPHIMVLKAKDCPNVKATMSRTIAQLVGNTEMLDDDEEETVAMTNTNRISATMTVLTSWYQQISKLRLQSPRKRSAGSPLKVKTKSSAPAPVVIILEHLESFNPTVLQDFITICSNHLHEIPFVFIFGIATTVTAVHRLLPQCVSSLLCMEKFQAPPSSECLTQVIQQIVTAPEFPFKLGGRVFHLLVDMFLYHDFSVLKFIQGFQFAMLDHFYNNAASIVCVPQADIESQVGRLSSVQLDAIRNLPSFRHHVENQPAKDRIRLLEEDIYTKKCVVELLDELHDFNHCLQPMVLCLHTFVHKLPGQPLGAKLREVYGTVLSQNICDSLNYSEALSLLKAMSRDELVEKLGYCVTVLTSETVPDVLYQVPKKLKQFQETFINIESLMRRQEEIVTDTNDITSPNKKLSLAGKMDLAQLKQSLQDFDKKKKKLTLYETTRNDLIDYLNTVFRRYLVCPQQLPLHEVLYYNCVASIKPHINGLPRSNLENALLNPYYYLQNEALMCDGVILPTLPDVCIVYKLHKECGRLINLYDWLQAFVMIVNASEDQENQPKPATPDQLLQARFIQAVSELQFLGFIKSTKRKTDHVARLTWGAC